MGRNGNATGDTVPRRSRAEDLNEIALESQRMGTGWIVLVVFGPLGIFGLGFLLVAVQRLRRIDTVRAARGWWLAVGVTATTTWVALTAAFGFLITDVGDVIPSEIGAVALVSAAAAGATTVAAWHVTAGLVGEPLSSDRKAANSLSAAAVFCAVFTAGVLWGSPVESVPVSGAMFTVLPAGTSLDWVTGLAAVAALWSFHRTQNRFRAGLASTAEAWRSWETSQVR